MPAACALLDRNEEVICPPVAASRLHAAFLAELPRFAAHARYATRHIACPDTRTDLVAEVLALAWRQFARLHRRGKDPGTFVTTLALRCSQAVSPRLAHGQRGEGQSDPPPGGTDGMMISQSDAADSGQ